jgi:hypothetical protein
MALSYMVQPDMGSSGEMPKQKSTRGRNALTDGDPR